jgi:hypothetical protein
VRRNIGLWLIAACALGGLDGCSKKKQEDGKAEAEKVKADGDKKPVGDRYKDGQRLASALKDWSKRWSDTTELPACDPLLKNAAEQELCKTAATALVTLKAAVAKPEPEATQIHLAAELAFATEAASEKLRTASMEKLQAERKAAGPAGSSTPKSMASAAAALAKARAVSSAHGKPGFHEKGKALEAAPVDPAMQVMQAYARVNRAALRYLSQFLQFGPLATRNAAFTELDALSKRKETWPALGRTLREAAMAENDPELQGKLKALAPKMSRRPHRAAPAAPGMPPGPAGMPPGHPAAPGEAAPPEHAAK